MWETIPKTLKKKWYMQVEGGRWKVYLLEKVSTERQENLKDASGIDLNNMWNKPFNNT